MNWTNAIPQVVYSIIGGAIVIIIQRKIFRIKKNYKEKDMVVNAMVNNINKVLTKDLDFKDMYLYLSYLTIHINLLNHYYISFHFYLFINMFLCIVGLGVALAVDQIFYAATWGFAFIVFTIILLYVTVPLGKTIASYQTTVWNKLHDIVHDFACID